MPNPPEIKAISEPGAPSLTDLMIEAGKRGIKTEASRIAVRKLVELTRAALGDAYPKFFDSPIGQQLEGAVVSAGLLWLCQTWQQIPQRDLLQSVALAGVEANAQNLVALTEQVIGPLVERLALQLAEGTALKVAAVAPELLSEGGELT